MQLPYAATTTQPLAFNEETKLQEKMFLLAKTTLVIFDRRDKKENVAFLKGSVCVNYWCLLIS